MSQNQIDQMKPLISVFIIIVSLFMLVFFQMEVRRLGYIVLKQTRELKSIQDDFRLKSMRFARVMRPDHLRDLAINKLTLNELKAGQVIHMSGEKVAIRQ